LRTFFKETKSKPSLYSLLPSGKYLPSIALFLTQGRIMHKDIFFT